MFPPKNQAEGEDVAGKGATRVKGSEQAAVLPFAVVAIGASAGGLEAFTEFIQALPKDPGMAFILFQPLPPDREGLLAEILQRSTQLPVESITDDAKVAANLNGREPPPKPAGMAKRALLAPFAPPAVVVDRDYRIVYFHGDTARYLDQQRGEPTQELMPLLPKFLRGPVRGALQEAVGGGGSAEVRVAPEGGDGVEVTVTTFGPNKIGGYCLVSFSPWQAPPGSLVAGVVTSLPLNQAEEELRRLREDLGPTIDKYQASSELLKTSNAGITSINEELPSTHEELETGKEELQSLNEELTTAHGPLQAKIEELEDTTSDLSSLFSSTDIAVIFLDRSGHIRRFTPSVKELVEVIPTDVGRRISDLALKFDDPMFYSDTEEVLHRLVPKEREIESRAGRSYVRRTLPYRTANNKIQGVVITFIDVTIRKKAETDLRRSEELYKIILDGLTEHAIVVLDPAGRFVTWPVSAERIFGYSSREVIGSALSKIYGESADDNGAAQKLGAALKTGSASDERWYKRKDGTLFWGTGTVSTLRDAKGELLGFVKVLRDYTEQKRSEESLERAKQGAERANAAKDQFLANVSHELRTPLASILLWTTVFEQTDAVDKRLMAEGIDAIRQSAEQQKVLIEDLIDTARIDSGKLRLDRSRAELAGLIESAIQTLKPSAKAKGLDLQVKLDPALGEVMLDPVRCQQIIWNLVGNAVKFTPDGGSVTLTAERIGNEIILQVKDTGDGISEDFMPNIFSRFGQAGKGTHRSSSGLGLGLSITHHLVELHGGTVQGESPGLGKGSTFTVKLPLRKLQPLRAFAIKPMSEPGSSLKGRHILLVEDDANLRRVLTVVLEAAEALVTSVESALAALDHFEKTRPDYIVSDIGLPKMDGYELIKRIRAKEAETGTEPVPALALTAFAGERSRIEALESGFQDWMAKPVEPTEILAALDGLCRN